ncbi:hypothetical protein Tco_0031961 [Tanacetum coccineum]
MLTLLINANCAIQPQQFDCYDVCGGPHYSSDCQTRYLLVYEPNPCNNYDFPYFDQPSQFTPPQPLLRSKITRADLMTYMIESQERFNKTQEQHYSRKETDEFIKSSVDDLVPIPRESEVTSDGDLECDMPATTPLPTTDVREENLDINLPLIEHLDTLSTGDREIDFNPIRDIEELERLLADDSVPVPRVFDAPLGHLDSISRSFDPGPPESTPVIDESTLLVTPPLLDPKQICLREVERFDPFFSLTQSGGTTRVMEIPSYGFHHMPSPRPAAYSPKEVMYRYFHPHLTTGD